MNHSYSLIFEYIFLNVISNQSFILPATTTLNAIESKAPARMHAVLSLKIQISCFARVTRKKIGNFSPKSRSHRAKFVKNLKHKNRLSSIVLILN